MKLDWVQLLVVVVVDVIVVVVTVSVDIVVIDVVVIIDVLSGLTKQKVNSSYFDWFSCDKNYSNLTRMY